MYTNHGIWTPSYLLFFIPPKYFQILTLTEGHNGGTNTEIRKDLELFNAFLLTDSIYRNLPLGTIHRSMQLYLRAKLFILITSKLAKP